MKVFLVWFWLVGTVAAAPYLTCDTNPLSTDPSQNVTAYIITGLSANPITVGATVDSSGGQYLHYDLATLPKGSYTVQVSAENEYARVSNPSAPFHFRFKLTNHPH